MDCPDFTHVLASLEGASEATDRGPRSTAVPALTHDLIEAILIATVHIVARCFDLNAARRHLSTLVFVAFDLEPLSRIVLPRLCHAWPPTTSAAHGRIDVLSQALRLGLLTRWISQKERPQTSRRSSLTLKSGLPAMIRTANTHGQVGVLRWIQRQWPKLFVTACDSSLVQVTITQLVVGWRDRGADMLSFWVFQSGVKIEWTAPLIQRAIALAFSRRDAPVLDWFAQNLCKLEPTFVMDWACHWKWDLVEQAVRDGAVDVVDVCIQAQEAGHVWFVEFEHRGLVSPPVMVSVSHRIMDVASQAGQVGVLEHWVQRETARGMPLIYSDKALDLCKSRQVLDWWKSSGLPLKYSDKAIHRATVLHDTSMLDWWLDMYRLGVAIELRYSSWTMALASADFKLEQEASNDLCGPDQMFSPTSPSNLVAMLQWWQDSGLQLKLPTPDDHGHVPSPIDLCVTVQVLDWWLSRAKQLHATAPESSIQDHFPHYTTTAMHRAAYWNKVHVLDWWMANAKGAGLEVRFLSHRIFELAAMAPVLQQPSPNRSEADYSLAWCLAKLPKFAFRGNLLSWTRASCDQGRLPSPPKWQTAVKNVRSIVSHVKQYHKVAVNLSHEGGLPPPESGYVMKESGEEHVFLPLRTLSPTG